MVSQLTDLGSRRVSQFTRLTPAIVGALPEDLRRTLSDGDLDPLRTFFGNTGARETANLTKALLSKKSIRLAILIYARVHGINISDKDLDTVQTALDPDAGGDLQPLLADGISAMETHYGLDETKKRLNVMGSGSDRGCNIWGGSRVSTSNVIALAEGAVKRRNRLGGMLRSYYREAA